MRIGWALFGPALLLAAAGASPEPSIDAHALRAHTRFLASDLLEGRGPGSRGDQLAQAYIAAQFEALGLHPVGAGGAYLQPFELVGITGAPKVLTAKGRKGRASFAYGDEVMLGAGTPRSRSSLEDAELVFVGYGIVAPEWDWDDYKGRDLKG